MSDGALKPEKDFSKEADKQIPEAEELAKVHHSEREVPWVLWTDTDFDNVLDRYSSGH